MERHRTRCRGAHPECVPVVVELDTWCIRRHDREAVPLRAGAVDDTVTATVRAVAAGDIVAKRFVPLTTQPSSTLVAVVAGRDRSCPAGSLIAAASTTSVGCHAAEHTGERARLRLTPRRTTATCHCRTMLSVAARCMLTPIVVAASPLANRDTATSTSCVEVTPAPPNATGIGATRKRPCRSAARCSVANVASRSWSMAPAANCSA